MNPALRRIPAAFDPRGRLSRRGYGRSLVRLTLIAMALLCLAIGLAGAGLRGAAILAFGTNLVVILAMLAATARRLHDRDRTGWWLAAYALVYAASLAPVDRLVEREPLVGLVIALGMLGFFVWFLIETMGRRGTPGPNRYGEEP